MEGLMDGALGVGEKVNAPEHIPVQGHACLPELSRVQTQNFAVSKYIQPQHTRETTGHLTGACVVGGRGVCQQV